MIRKVTTGYMIQEFDEVNGVWVSQEFITGDDYDWEDEHGVSLDIDDVVEICTNEPYLEYPNLLYLKESIKLITEEYGEQRLTTPVKVLNNKESYRDEEKQDRIDAQDGLHNTWEIIDENS